MPAGDRQLVRGAAPRRGGAGDRPERAAGRDVGCVLLGPRRARAALRTLWQRREIVYGPIVQAADGMEEFAVRDRDGYVLGFGQPVAQ